MIFSVICQESRKFTIGGKKALVTHGHYYGVSIDLSGIADEARSRGCEIAFFGHTHKPVVAQKNGVLVINPGSLAYPRQSGRKSSYVILNTDIRGNIDAQIKYLD